MKICEIAKKTVISESRCMMKRIKRPFYLSKHNSSAKCVNAYMNP